MYSIMLNAFFTVQYFVFSKLLYILNYFSFTISWKVKITCTLTIYIYVHVMMYTPYEQMCLIKQFADVCIPCERPGSHSAPHGCGCRCGQGPCSNCFHCFWEKFHTNRSVFFLHLLSVCCHFHLVSLFISVSD